MLAHLCECSYLRFIRVCPGRFFAVNELKAMMCWLVLNYDVKAEKEGVRPENMYQRTTVAPNPFAKVQLRRRKCEA